MIWLEPAPTAAPGEVSQMIFFGVLFGLLLALLLFGFVGGLAGAMVGGGREDRSLPANAGIGLVGSLIGGTLWNTIQDRGFELTWGGFFASLLGSILFLLVVGALRKRPTSTVEADPSPPVGRPAR